MRFGNGAMAVGDATAGIVALPLSRVRKNQQQKEGEKCSHGSSLIDVPCFMPNGECDQCRSSHPEKQLNGEAIHSTWIWFSYFVFRYSGFLSGSSAPAGGAGPTRTRPNRPPNAPCILSHSPHPTPP